MIILTWHNIMVRAHGTTCAWLGRIC